RPRRARASAFASFATLESSGESGRQAALAHLALRVLDRICDPMERSRPPFEIQQQPSGTWVAVPRLSHRAGIEQPASVELDPEPVRREPAYDLFAVHCQRER